MQSIHAETLTAFLATDLLRLETALDGQTWNDALSARLSDHLHRLAGIIALVQGVPSDEPTTVDSVDGALEALHRLTRTLLQAVTAMPEGRLDAPVLDWHERGLNLLGHLYDYARLSAALVEWSRGLPQPPTLGDWFADEGE